VRASTAATSWSEGTLVFFPDGTAGATPSGGRSSKKIAGERKVGGSFDASAITTSPSSPAALSRSASLSNWSSSISLSACSDSLIVLSDESDELSDEVSTYSTLRARDLAAICG